MLGTAGGGLTRNMMLKNMTPKKFRDPATVIGLGGAQSGDANTKDRYSSD